jgi:hypothetical protein
MVRDPEARNYRRARTKTDLPLGRRQGRTTSPGTPHVDKSVSRVSVAGVTFRQRLKKQPWGVKSSLIWSAVATVKDTDNSSSRSWIAGTPLLILMHFRRINCLAHLKFSS